jgi:hypothetical protein
MYLAANFQSATAFGGLLWLFAVGEGANDAKIKETEDDGSRSRTPTFQRCCTKARVATV